MAMTAASMVAKINAARASVPPSDGSAGQASAQADASLLALCQGIIDEIQDNAVATGSDPQGGTVTSTIA